MPFDPSLFDTDDTLKAHPKKAEIIAKIQEAIEEEKTKGIEAKHRANKEVMGLKGFKNAILKLGFNPDTDDLEEFLGKVKVGNPEDDNKSSAEMVKLQKQLEKLNAAFLEKEKEANDLKDKTKKGKMRSILEDALRDRVFGHQYVINDLIGSGKVSLDDDENLVFVNGEETVDFKTGIKNFLASNQDILKNTQKAGGGSSQGSNSKAKYSPTDLDSMSIEDIIANKAEVLASLKAARPS